MNTKSLACAFTLLPLLSTSHAATALWSDPFNQADSLNIRDLSGRQVFATGSNLTPPIGFLTNAVSPTQPTNYHEQIQGNKLLLAGDAMTNSAAGTYGYAGITVGGSTIAASGTVGFSVRFIEDNNFGNGNFIQLYDGSTLIQNLLPNPAGAGLMDVDLYFSDSDSNPWDGIGGTTISVFVNDIQVGTTFTKGGGGFSNNFISFEGSDDKVTHNIATHTIDSVTIVAVPEPASALLAGLGVLGLLSRRRPAV